MLVVNISKTHFESLKTPLEKLYFISIQNCVTNGFPISLSKWFFTQICVLSKPVILLGTRILREHSPNNVPVYRIVTPWCLKFTILLFVRFCTSISFGERLKLVFQEPHSPKREGVTLDTEQSVVLSSLRNAGNLQLLLPWCLSPDQTPRNQARRMPSLKKQKFRKKIE